MKFLQLGLALAFIRAAITDYAGRIKDFVLRAIHGLPH